jgi:hypothetical protein
MITNKLVPDALIPAVILKSAGPHPLFYRKRIARVAKAAKSGDLVEVHDADGNRIGAWSRLDLRSHFATFRITLVR